MGEWWKGIRDYRIKKEAKPDSNIGNNMSGRSIFLICCIMRISREIIWTKLEVRIERDSFSASAEGGVIDEQKLDGSFSEEEVEDGINILARGKAPGEDGITGEFLKAAGMENIKMFTGLFNRIWEGGGGRSPGDGKALS